MQDWDPEASPDGAAIAFTRATGAPVPGAIYVMGTDGRGLRRLTRGPFDASPAWSANGARIAFDRYEGSNVYKFFLVG